jgi:hypothetical protein
MRRAQSVRHYARPSIALGADDLGILKEGDESNEDVLRRQLLDKDRENDKVKLLFCFGSGSLAETPQLNSLATYPNPITSGPALPASPGGESSGDREGIQELGFNLARDAAGE